MFKFSFGKKQKERVWIPDKNAQTPEEWLPFKEIDGQVIILKNGAYLTILEVTPINFKLKSKIEKRSIILNYREFLKACNFPIQISIQCRKASIDPHILKMEKHCKAEENENAKWMGKGYIELVRTLGAKGAVSRRFFLIVPYVLPQGIKEPEFEEVKKQLSEKVLIIKEYLKQCGNLIVEPPDKKLDESIIDILRTCINKNI